MERTHKPWCSERARRENGGCICVSEPSKADIDWPRQQSGARFEYRTLDGEWQVYGFGLRHVCICHTESTADMVTRALNKTL